MFMGTLKAKRGISFMLGFLLLAAVPVPQTFTSSNCSLDGPPDALGEDGFQGTQGYVFDHWSDSGHPAEYHFQLLVRNMSSKPLTFNWENADFFRRGTPPVSEAPKNEARSQCRKDGNPPNVLSGYIMYGPNTQFTGPDARFYNYQRVADAGQDQDDITFDVRWTAVLDDGLFNVQLLVSSKRLDESAIEYSITNTGDNVALEWPDVLTESTITTVLAQNPGVELLAGQRLLVPSDRTLGVQVSGTTAIEAFVSPVTVATPDGLILYRDVFSALRFRIPT